MQLKNNEEQTNLSHVESTIKSLQLLWDHRATVL